MKDSKFSQICDSVAVIVLVIGILSGIVVGFQNGSFLLFIYFFVPTFLTYVIFGSIAEHLKRMAWITQKMGYEEKERKTFANENKKEKDYDEFLKEL